MIIYLMKEVDRMRKRGSIYVLAAILLGILALMPNVISYWGANLCYLIIFIVSLIFLAITVMISKKEA